MNTFKTVIWNLHPGLQNATNRHTKPLFPFLQLLTQIQGLERPDPRAQWFLSSQPNTHCVQGEGGGNWRAPSETREKVKREMVCFPSRVKKSLPESHLMTLSRALISRLPQLLPHPSPTSLPHLLRLSSHPQSFSWSWTRKQNNKTRNQRQKPTCCLLKGASSAEEKASARCRPYLISDQEHPPLHCCS